MNDATREPARRQNDPESGLSCLDDAIGVGPRGRGLPGFGTGDLDLGPQSLRIVDCAALLA